MKKINGKKLVKAVIHSMDRLIDTVIALVLLIAVLYGGFGLWDTWNIYHNAGVSDDLLKYKPTWISEDTPNPSISELQEINPDVVAWLTVDGTNIDYPVVQGETNMEYINQAVDKSFSLTGSIFLDFQNQSDFTDFYSLIYGHHIAGNVMFGEVPNFLEDDYFESHTTGTLFLPDESRRIQWFACIQTDAYDKYMFTPTVYEDIASRQELLAYIRLTATQYRAIDVMPTDQIIVLSTCSEASTNGRVLLVGRLD
jgi:sortase B